MPSADFVLAGQIREANTAVEDLDGRMALRLDGRILPITKVSNYRLNWSSDNNRGYYVGTSGQTVYIFDVTDFKDKTLRITRRRRENTFHYAFVTDYMQIPSGSPDTTIWDAILISGSRCNTTDDAGTVVSSNYTVPSDDGNIYLCVSCFTDTCNVVSPTDGVLTNIEDLQENKQDVLTIDPQPRNGSNNPISSDAVFKALKPIAGDTGIQNAIYTRSGYRIVYSGSTRGYYYGQSSASVVIFDVTSLQGKRISIKQTRQNNAYAYAFVTDYTLIPTSENLEVWNSIFISGVRETTSASSTYITRNVTVPNGYEHLYLCVTQINSFPVEIISLEDIVAPLTLEEINELRKGGSAGGNITYQPTKLGIVPITSIRYDYNVIIGYGQSLAAASGFVADDLLPNDDNALMFYLKYSTVNSNIWSKNLEKVACVGNTSSTQDCPPNATATIDFAKLFRLKTGNADKKFVHICPAQGSMTIAQLMDFARYKEVDTDEFYFPSLDTGYASIRPYQVLQRQLTRIKQIADAEGKTVGVIAVNWNQGEADYGSQSGIAATTTEGCSCNGDAEEYINRLRALHDDIWEDIQSILGQTEQPAWFIAQCSGQFVKSSFSINQALIEICDGKLYFPTHSTYPVPNKDDGHPTGNGYRWYGEYLAKAMADVLLRNNQPELLTVKKIIAKTDSIKLYCQVPNPPLRSETNLIAEMTNFGFALRTADDSANVTISSVNIDNDVITITPLNPLTEGANYNLHYGTHYATGKYISSIVAAGNICDSDAYHGNFNCMAEITSAVEYQPLAEDGSPLVGHPYPLFNFLLPFKKVIEVS